MKCPVCNAEVPSGGAFCAQCGAKLPPAETAEKTRSGGSTMTAAALSDAGAAKRRAADVPEETLWEGSYSAKAMIGPLVGCAVATVALVVGAVMMRESSFWAVPLGVALLLWIFAAVLFLSRRLGVSYKLTNQMFYHRTGVLTRVTNRIELIEVHDVTYEQGLIERAVNIGRILITSSDRTDPRLWLRGIEEVESIAKKIDDARRAEQIRRGRRIESIGVVDN